MVEGKVQDGVDGERQISICGMADVDGEDGLGDMKGIPFRAPPYGTGTERWRTASMETMWLRCLKVRLSGRMLHVRRS